MYPSTIKVQKIGHDKFVSGTFNNKLIKFRIKWQKKTVQSSTTSKLSWEKNNIKNEKKEQNAV